jgi:hypothetical protein
MTARTPPAFLFLAMLAVLNMGCRSQPTSPDQGSVVQHGPLPTYAEVAKGYNSRVERLDRVEALVALNVTARNAKGEQIKNQVEGNLKIMLPASVSLRVDKVGKPVFYLGSNDQQYWWVDLTADPKVAMVGKHAAATPEAVKDFGVPVHPLDLIEVMAVKPLPPAVEPNGAKAKLAWTDDGRSLLVTLPGRWGERRLTLDPRTYEPTRVELLDGEGKAVVSCRHTNFQPVEVVGDAAAQPRITRRIDLTLPVQEATVTVAVYEPRNPGPNLRVQVFNLRAVLQNFNVNNVVDIDRARAENPPPAPALGTSPGATPATTGAASR